MKTSNKNIISTKTLSAFTVAEMVVVVTILAIMSTISFFAYTNYTSGARDAVRLTDISSIANGLKLEFLNSQTYPTPDDNIITITASGLEIGFQGNFGGKLLSIVKLKNTEQSGKDPLDKTSYYTYNINSSQDKYQLAGFLENTNSVSYYGLDNTFADNIDFSKRFIYTKGSNLGVILNSGTLLPLQNTLTNGTGFELTNATGSDYMAYINKDITMYSSGTMMGGLYGFYTAEAADSTYPDCDTPDILLSNGQVWAACNAGATQSRHGQADIINCGSDIDCNSSIRNTLGGFYQWGRNDEVSGTTITGALASTGTLANTVGHSYFIIGPADPFDWIISKDDNLWGGGASTYLTGTFTSLGKPTAMQGPCASGYHVPTQLEIYNSANAINPSLQNTIGYQNDIAMANILKIPFSCIRNHAEGWIGCTPNLGRIWTSTPNSIRGLYVEFNEEKTLYFLDSNQRARGLSVRCIKN